MNILGSIFSYIRGKNGFAKVSKNSIKEEKIIFLDNQNNVGYFS